MTWALPLGGSSGPWDESEAADQAAWAGWLGSYSARGCHRLYLLQTLAHSIGKASWGISLKFHIYPRVFTISEKG